MNNSITLIVIFITLLFGVTSFIYYRIHKSRLESALQKAKDSYLVPKDRIDIIKLELEKTKSGQELLSRIIKPLIPENELEKSIDIQEKASISVWGPIGSGKTYLLNSFQFNTYKLYNSLDVQYKFVENGKNVNPFEIRPEKSKADPTSYLEITDIVLSRRFRKKDYGTKISSHKHHIVLFDEKGEAILDALSDHKVISNDSAAYRSVLAKSTGIIFVLNKGNTTSEEYFLLLKTALENLETIREHPGYYAFCVTKADVFTKNFANADVDDLLIMSFGQEWAQKILNLIEEQGKIRPIFLCACSSVGFYVDVINQVEKSNVNPGTSAIINYEEWNPIGVEKPFFWILEKIEENRLSQMYSQRFIGKYLFARAMKHYIPFPKN
jgi:hypothetical protein